VSLYASGVARFTAPETSAPADAEEKHYYCCDDTRALCGIAVYPDPDGTSPAPEEACCEICVNRNRLAQPCGDPLCPHLTDGWIP
jgi:hypothetical protein